MNKWVSVSVLQKKNLQYFDSKFNIKKSTPISGKKKKILNCANFYGREDVLKKKNKKSKDFIFFKIQTIQKLREKSFPAKIMTNQIAYFFKKLYCSIFSN